MVSARRGRCAIAAMAALAGCEIGSTTIPLSDPQVVVHAILNPSLSTQTLLLEESLTGKGLQATGFDPNNPITRTGGIPISGAVVQLTGPEGVRTAGEIRNNGRPTGIYQILGSVQPGARYDVTILAIGHTITGTTQVPGGTPAPAPDVVIPFNRDHGSLELPIQNANLARAHWVRIEAAFAAFELFTTDPQVTLSGATRNLFTDDLLRVFFPGFQQAVTVAAMDTNVYDYYRSGNDPFSGVGLISHLSGGIGLFGSMTVVDRHIVEVSQDPTGDPIEGVYTRRNGAEHGMPATITLFLESRAASSEAFDRITGTWAEPDGTRGNLIASRSGSKLFIGAYEPGSTTRPREGGFTGVIAGDTLRDTFFGNPTIYVRQGK